MRGVEAILVPSLIELRKRNDRISPTVLTSTPDYDALRLTYVGELGWELYVAWDDAVAVFDALRSVGAEHGMELCGYHALNSLRFERPTTSRRSAVDR